MRKRKGIRRGGGTEEIMGRSEKQNKIVGRCKKQKKMMISRESKGEKRKKMIMR